MQVARPAAAGADRQLAGDRGLAPRRERGGLLVAGVLPRPPPRPAARRSASVKPLSESPGNPYTRRTPAFLRVSTIRSEMVRAIEWLPLWSRRQDHREGGDALGGVHGLAADVGRPGRARQQHRV